MLRRHGLALASFTVALALGLAGCSDDAGDQEKAAAPSSSPSPSESAPSTASPSATETPTEPRPGDRVRGVQGVEDAPVSAVLPPRMEVVTDLDGARRFDTADGNGTILYGFPAVVHGKSKIVRATKVPRVIDAIRSREDLKNVSVEWADVAGARSAVVSYEAAGTEGAVMLTWQQGEGMQPLPGATTTVLVPADDGMLWVNFESNTGDGSGVPQQAREQFLQGLRLG